jgi:hypothetical protein
MLVVNGMIVVSALFCMKDLFSDQGHLFACATLKYDLPDYVRDGDTQMDKSASLADSCFADPVSRLFPLHTKAHVFSSAVYAHKQAGVGDDIRNAILDRAKTFGIQEDIEKVAAFVSSLEEKGAQKTASHVAPFVIEIGTPSISKICGAGPESAQRAFSKLAESLDDMEPQNITKAAVSLVSAFRENGLQPDSNLLKLAGVGQNDPSFIREQMDLRCGLIPDPMERGRAATKLASISTAEDLLTFDRENGLSGFYGERLCCAHEVFHSGAEMKKAAAAGSLEALRESFSAGTATFQAVSASAGADRANSMLKAGSLDLTEAEAALVNQYLQGQ